MSDEVRLTEWTECGGCAAKWGATALRGLVSELPGSVDAELLVGLAPSDDAAVYRVADDVALVSTADFFPPLVDDPGDFGAIAAANACSDVFAMGARVVMALNLSAFPEALPREAIAAILAGAAERVAAAGGTTAGGHTIRSDEPIFGLAVQGIVHPDRILTKAGARSGDTLVLSKSLGTGLVLAGGSTADKAAAIAGMRELNRAASEALVAADGAVHAATDVTGFGLAGHGWEMADRSAVRLTIEGSALPLYAGARVRPRPVCARAAIPATGTTWPATPTVRPTRSSRPWSTTPRPLAGCWLPSTPAWSAISRASPRSARSSTVTRA